MIFFLLLNFSILALCLTYHPPARRLGEDESPGHFYQPVVQDAKEQGTEEQESFHVAGWGTGNRNGNYGLNTFTACMLNL